MACNVFETDIQFFFHKNQLHLFLINEFVSTKKSEQNMVKRQETKNPAHKGKKTKLLKLRKN